MLRSLYTFTLADLDLLKLNLNTLRSLSTLRLLSTLKSSSTLILLDSSILRSSLDTLRSLSLGIIRLLDLNIIETVPVATKIIKRVATVYEPNKVIIKVVESAKAFINTIIIDFNLVKAKVILEIAKTTLKAVIEYSFIVLD